MSFKVTLNASTDNTAVTSYDVFLDGSLNVNTDNTTYTINGLTASNIFSYHTSKRCCRGEYISTKYTSRSQHHQWYRSSQRIGSSEYVEGSSINKALDDRKPNRGRTSIYHSITLDDKEMV